MINWKVRFKNKNFWLAFIPAVILLIKSILDLFNVHIDMTELQTKLLNVVNALFVALAILGIITDPTTDGTGDSIRALSYEEPYKD